MNKLIDRDETNVYNGVKYDFTLYWGKDARNGGLFGTPPSSVGITKWLGSNPTDYKIIHISVDTGRKMYFGYMKESDCLEKLYGRKGLMRI